MKYIVVGMLVFTTFFGRNYHIPVTTGTTTQCMTFEGKNVASKIYACEPFRDA